MPKASTNSQTLKEYGRGIIGGLIFSLPIIYTMEVWWTGFIASPFKILVFVIATYALLLGYNRYAGMRKDATFKDVCWDSVEEICLAFIITFLFLLLIHQVSFQMSFLEIAGKVIIESMIVAIGISVGTAQLGEKHGKNKGGMSGDGEGNEKEELKHIVVLAICGAALFSSPVAPTEEILMIAVEAEASHILLLLLFSILLSFTILYFSDFRNSARKKQSFGKMCLHVLLSYSAALLVSFGFLWFFGRLEGNSLEIIIFQMIVLSVPGAIGASAGRLLIKG